MITTGKLLSATSVSTAIDEQPKTEARVLKVGHNMVLVGMHLINMYFALLM